MTSERARFLQVRATLVGKDGATPVLDSVTAAYLQRNLRPQVQSDHRPSAGRGLPEAALAWAGRWRSSASTPARLARARPGAPAPAMPPAVTFSRKLYQRASRRSPGGPTIANGDTLVYDVYYRAVGDSRFRRCARASPTPSWPGTPRPCPNGRYVIKVAASDAPSQPRRPWPSPARRRARPSTWTTRRPR